MVLRAWTVPPYFLTASTRKGGGGKERAIIKEVQSSSQAHHFGIALCETEESEYVLGTIFVDTAPRFFDPPIFCVFFYLGSLGNSENRTPSSTFSSMIRVLATSKGVVTPPAMPPATDPHAAPGPNPGDGHG